MPQQGKAALVRGKIEYQLWMWHKRLGHPSFGYLKKLFPTLSGSNISFDCEAFILAKSHKHSYPNSDRRTNKPFILIHLDVWGPAPKFNNHGFLYYVTLIDDCTRMSWVYFLRSKSDVYKTFVSFYKMAQT